MGQPEWRRVFDAATWVLAHEAERAIGLARSVREPGRPSARYVESAWVAPTHRRHGVFRALLHALAETGRRVGVTDLLLWVLEDNHDAQRAYEALGFEPTGERQFLPAFGRFERRLRLGLGAYWTHNLSRRRFRVDDSSAELSASPGLQPQEVHGLPSAAYVVYARGELLPFVEVVPPGFEEVDAKAR